jgi:hypothetical protein
MSRIKSLAAPALKMLAVLIATAAAVGLLAVNERVEEAVFAAWRAVGDQLAKRELTAIAQQLDLERQDAAKIQDSRDSIAIRLIVLEAQRELVAAESQESGSRYRDGRAHELAVLDRAISVLRSTANRADCVLRGANDDLRARRIELSALQSDDDARRMNEALERPIGDPALWSSRVARARVIIGPVSADHADRYTALNSASAPIVQE